MPIDSIIRKPSDENAPPSGPYRISSLNQALSSQPKSPTDPGILSSSAISSTMISPTGGSPSRHGADWGLNGDLPRLPPVASASQLPLPQARSSPASAPIPTAVVFEQSRNLLDKQRNAAEQERQTFAAERALWDIERQALYARVQELEKALNAKNGLNLRKHNSSVSPLEMGPPSFSTFSAQGEVDTLSAFSSGHESRLASTESNGDEFWRGAGARKGSVATRTFSDSSTRPSKPEEGRLPSIAETDSPRKSSLDLTSSTNPAEGPAKKASGSKEGVILDKEFDGIKFKSSSHIPENAIITPQSPSPKQNISPSQLTPGNIEIPPATLSAPDHILTKDAGHTPLARNIDGTDDSSKLASGAQTPTQEGPRHPRASVARPPTERSDSYFPPVTEDEDPELKAPLNLRNDGHQDKAFLDELDSKLTNAAKSPTSEMSETEASENQKPTTRADSSTDDPKFDQPEHEPKLRIRRSMNFGAPLGMGRFGKV